MTNYRPTAILLQICEFVAFMAESIQATSVRNGEQVNGLAHEYIRPPVHRGQIFPLLDVCEETREDLCVCLGAKMICCVCSTSGSLDLHHIDFRSSMLGQYCRCHILFYVAEIQ